MIKVDYKAEENQILISCDRKREFEQLKKQLSKLMYLCDQIEFNK